MVLPPTSGHLAITGDIFDCHDCGMVVLLAGIWSVEARDVANILQSSDQPLQQRSIQCPCWA